MSDTAPIEPEVAANPETAQPTEPVPQPEIPPPEPPPFWAARKYIRRSFNFDLAGKTTQGNFFDLGNGQLDVDGLFGDKEYQSLIELQSFVSESDRNTVLSKIDTILKTRA